MNISLDTSVKHITKVACMALSGIIENGLMLSANPNAEITIYKDRIDFGRCANPDLAIVSGLVCTNYYKEYGNIVYRYGSNIKCSFFGNTLDYVGLFAPTVPDNIYLFNQIYPRFS